MLVLEAVGEKAVGRRGRCSLRSLMLLARTSVGGRTRGLNGLLRELKPLRQLAASLGRCDQVV